MERNVLDDRKSLDLKAEVTDALTLCQRTDLLLTDWEWECLSGALQLLQSCQFLTADLSSSSYPSVSKVLPSSKILKDKLAALTATNYHDALIVMSSNLRRNIMERLADYRSNAIHLISIYLDPRLSIL
ncbi:hypothetical protein DAPPUDRAFT_246178 [Daphnia pulex]|uniref:Uncharacterized protein n=1 Tax=Daphnia pulex TaxID=6669 RepID=E9GPT8_DAPPU|nr:hypothetical protein DAPPUDRAFT_246178 [Daphnia pulex]|eukprot:EFX78532.1 hypothetical protein DAPPUDRAFT_246178 [Daphnia pulex]